MKKLVFYVSFILHPMVFGFALLLAANHYFGGWGMFTWIIWAFAHICLHQEMLDRDWHI
jgi:hypothetical protein